MPLRPPPDRSEEEAPADRAPHGKNCAARKTLATIDITFKWASPLCQAANPVGVTKLCIVPLKAGLNRLRSVTHPTENGQYFDVFTRETQRAGVSGRQL